METLIELIQMFQSARRLCSAEADKMSITLTSTDIRIICYALSNLAFENNVEKIIGNITKD